MPKTDKPLKAKRYRIYFWLMDLSTAVMAVFVSVSIADLFDERDLREVFPYLVVILIGAFSQIVAMLIMPFLICAKFMRDDYSDALWRRSITVLAYATATIPLMIFSTTLIYDLTVGLPRNGPPLIRWATVKVPWGQAIIDIWISYMILFITIFQLLRWRDSR